MFNTFIFDTQEALCNNYILFEKRYLYLLIDSIFGDEIMTQNVMLLRSINAGKTMK